MCGIVGGFGWPSAKAWVGKRTKELVHRGPDGTGFTEDPRGALGHCLFSLVGSVPQPLVGRGRFVANCEIYNWRELATANGLNPRNDAELLFLLLEKSEEKEFPELLDSLDGVFAFGYWRDGKVFLARDLLGVKPLWVGFGRGFAFASEKKVLKGFRRVFELNPRHLLTVDLEKKRFKSFYRGFFETGETDQSQEKIEETLETLVVEAVAKRIPDKPWGILFSGGLDSTILAKVSKAAGFTPLCYVAGLVGSADIQRAEEVAKEFGFELRKAVVEPNEVEGLVREAVKVVESTNAVKIAVALPLLAATKAAHNDGIKVLLSGNGSEDVFAGYARFEGASDVNSECLSGLRKIYERDAYRDDAVSMRLPVELRFPFLDHQLVEYGLKIPGNLKIRDGKRKWILRKTAERLGIGIASWGKRTAAQYGSGFDAALEKLATESGFKFKSDYLKSLRSEPNCKVGVLFSSGKDSTYALHLMEKQNYKVACLITIKSKNKDSYLFHTPAVDLTSLQAEVLGLPQVTVETAGKKETELEDLKIAMKLAKKNHGIEGIVTGAIFSSYQRDRIERTADEVGLKIFSPLWHKNQENVLKALLSSGFEIVMTAVAAEGLDKSWLGRKISWEDVEKLKVLQTKFGINIAGEGGEYETLVLDAPLFKKRLKILEKRIVEDGSAARLEIGRATLEPKESLWLKPSGKT